MSDRYADVFTGDKYEAGRPLEQITGLVRADLDAAVAAGAFPVGVTLEVKAGEQPGHLAVIVRGLPAEFTGSEVVAAQVSVYANAYNRISRPLYGDEDHEQVYTLDIWFAKAAAPAVAANQVRAHYERWHGQLTETERLYVWGAHLALRRVAGRLRSPAGPAEHFAGPGQWRSQAEPARRPDNMIAMAGFARLLHDGGYLVAEPFVHQAEQALRDGDADAAARLLDDAAAHLWPDADAYAQGLRALARQLSGQGDGL